MSCTCLICKRKSPLDGMFYYINQKISETKKVRVSLNLVCLECGDMLKEHIRINYEEEILNPRQEKEASKNLLEGIHERMKYARLLLEECKNIPQSVFYSATVNEILLKAEKAIEQGDTIAMLKVYTELGEIN